MNTFFMAFWLASWLGLGAIHPMPKYGVKVTRDKTTDFTRLKTYSWTTGWSVYDKEVDQQIVAAVDRGLAAAGLTKLDHDTGDVIVRYASLRRTDVDLHSKISPVTQMRREYDVGTLVVLLLDPGNEQELWRGRADMPLAADRSALFAQVDRAISKMFSKYPSHRRR